MCVLAPSREILETWSYCWRQPEGECRGSVCQLLWSPGRSQPCPRHMLNLEARLSDRCLYSMQLDPFQRKPGRWAASSALSLGGITMVTASVPITASLFAIDCGYCGWTPHLFSELSVLGAQPQVRVLKAGHHMCGPNPLLLKKNLGIGGSPQIVWLCTEWGLWQECISAFPNSFHCEYFLVYPMCRNHSASFWISFKRNCSLCSCAFCTSKWRREVRSLFCHHLTQFHVQLFTWQSSLNKVIFF